MGATVDREQILDALINVAKGVGASPAQVALRGVRNQDGPTPATVCPRNGEQHEENLGAVDLELDGDAWKTLDRASRLPLTYPAGLVMMMQRRREAQLQNAQE